MKDGREIRDYLDLQLVLRERAAELNVSRICIDEVSGLSNGYAGKLLCVPPVKCLGRTSFGRILQALGLKLVAVADPEALATVSERLFPKARGDTRSASIDRIVEARLRESRSERARRGAAARNASLTPDQRIASARRAATIRWARRGGSHASTPGADRRALVAETGYWQIESRLRHDDLGRGGVGPSRQAGGLDDAHAAPRDPEAARPGLPDRTTARDARRYIREKHFPRRGAP